MKREKIGNKPPENKTALLSASLVFSEPWNRGMCIHQQTPSSAERRPCSLYEMVSESYAEPFSMRCGVINHSETHPAIRGLIGFTVVKSNY